MVEVERGGTADTLMYFQEVLDRHFRTIYDRRKLLPAPAPVFALEHGLGEDDRRLLHEAVVAAHKERLLTRASSRWWLPLVVHAAEIGYIYDGVEFWPTYADKTPGWCDSDYERDRVRDWFRNFANNYGGAIPQGAWAKTFRKIAWPITHAVLPRYLQVQLARMLYDYRTGWPSFLDDPRELGNRLHVWSRHYGERLEKFCQNTELLGHVTVALLLSREDEPSPYIESSLMDRLVESINCERQARSWLHDARRSASSVKTHNFRPAVAGGARRSSGRRVPAITDPRLQLKLQNGVWHAYAIIPDLRSLQHSLPMVYEGLKNSRGSVAGSREVIRSGALLYALAPIKLSSWPLQAEPFLQLKNVSPEVNLLLADQCRVTGGPWWVFRCKQGEPASEVKGKFVRPRGQYCIVGAPGLTPPNVSWCEPTEIAVDGVAAYLLQVPAALSDADSRALVSSGLSVVSDLSIQPVGVVASSWDGEGTAEWLAGEPALIMVRADHPPDKCRLMINGEPYYLEWPSNETEMFFALDGLAVGNYELVVALDDLDGKSPTTGGSLVVAIRDPQALNEGAFAGEGIRLRTSPAYPSLSELWDGKSTVEVDGPAGTNAELTITLQDSAARVLANPLTRTLTLPITSDGWRRRFVRWRETNELARHYDEADVAEIAISRAGLGFARLSCERGYRGLRWVMTTSNNRGYSARLIDRTDAETLTVEFSPMERPMTVNSLPASGEFEGPPRGGLLWASNDGQAVGQILPPNPNQLLQIGATNPVVPVRPKSLAEVQKIIRHHRRWSDAELPAHPFGMRDRMRVLEAITSGLAMMLAPGHWAHFEQEISGKATEDIDLDYAQGLLGDTASHWAAARAIASNLWRWNTPEALIVGFSEAVSHLISSSGMPDVMKGSRFLLQLASSPGELETWNMPELKQYLRCVFTDPVLMRAARFAVLGTTDEIAGRAL